MMFVCAISTEGAPCLRFLEEFALSAAEGAAGSAILPTQTLCRPYKPSCTCLRGSRPSQTNCAKGRGTHLYWSCRQDQKHGPPAGTMLKYFALWARVRSDADTLPLRTEFFNRLDSTNFAMPARNRLTKISKRRWRTRENTSTIFASYAPTDG
jgi:hypothetical protein